MKQIKQLLITGVFTLLTFTLSAQQHGRMGERGEKGGRGEKGERVESLKIAFISGKLNLDPKTAERFWPIYNQYEQELKVVAQEYKAAKKSDDVSADDLLDQQQKVIDLKRKYNSIFLKVINNEQLNRLYQAEKEFRQMVMRRAGK